MYIKFKIRIIEAFRKFFPELRPAGYDDQANPCYSIEDIAKAFGLTTDEVRKAFSNRDPERIIAPDKVHRIQ